MVGCLSVVGALFDIIQVAVQIGDVSTDYLLLYEWYNDADMRVFFWLLLTVCCIAAVVSSAALVFSLMHRLKVNTVAWLLFWIGCFIPVSPFAGLINLVAHKLARPGEMNEAISIARADYDASTFQAVSAKNNARASAELFGSLLKQHKALSTLDSAIATRANSYINIIVSMLAESLCSALIQLVAASITGNLSTISVVSLVLSLASIALKSFLVARSFCPKVTVFKIACIALDVFLFAYLCSSVFHRDDLDHHVVNVSTDRNGSSWTLVNRSVPAPAANSSNVALFGIPTLLVTRLSYGWVITKLITTAMLLVFAWYLVVMFAVEVGARDGCKLVPLVLLLIIVLFPVAVTAQECIHASILVIFALLFLEPEGSHYPAAGCLHAWLYTAPSSSKRAVVVDWRRTLDKVRQRAEAALALAREASEKLYAGTATAAEARMMLDRILAELPSDYHITESDQRDGWRRALQYWQQTYVGSKPLTIEDNWLSRVIHLHCLKIYRAEERVLRAFAADVVYAYDNNNLRRAASPEVQSAIADRLTRAADKFDKEGKDRLQQDHFLAPDAPHALRPDDAFISPFLTGFVRRVLTGLCHDSPKYRHEASSFFWATLSCIVCTLYSAGFTVAHAALYWHNDTPIARISFGVVCVAASVMLLTAVPFVRYYRSCVLFQHRWDDTGGGLSGLLELQHATAAVDLWNSLPLSLCGQAVPSDVVPSDALEKHVLAFLTVEHCGLHGIPNSEFAEAMCVFSASRRLHAVEEQGAEEQQIGVAVQINADRAEDGCATLPQKRDSGLRFNYAAADADRDQSATTVAAAPARSGGDDERSPLLGNKPVEYATLREHDGNSRY